MIEDTTKSKPFKKELQVELTIDERLDYSDKLSRGVQDLQGLNDSKAESSKDYAARIKAAEANLGNVSRILSNGYEYRSVECYWHYNWLSGQKTLYRTDNMKELKQEAITMEERQFLLDLEEKAEKEKENTYKSETGTVSNEEIAEVVAEIGPMEITRGGVDFKVKVGKEKAV